MAVKRKIPLNQIEGVTAGGTAIITLPKGVRYHSIHLEYKTGTAGGSTEANCEAELTEIRVDIDEVTQRKASAKELFDINRTKGVTPNVGAAVAYLPIFFSEPQRDSKIKREATAWGTANVGSFQVAVDIDAGATNPILGGYAIIDDVFEAPQGIVKWKRNTITVGATGELPYRLDTEKGDSYQGIFLFETADGNIDDLLLEWDGTKLVDFDDTEWSDNLKNLFVPEVSALVHLPLDENQPEDVVPSVKIENGQLTKIQEFLLTLNMGAANNVTIIRELVGSPD
jgi:hypothetical protein